MKTGLLLFFLVVCTSYLAAGQPMPGLRLGGSISKINGISISDGKYDWLKQWHGGLVLEQKIGTKLYLQPELVYSEKGYIYRATMNNPVVHRDTVSYHERTYLRYFDAPLLFKIESKGLYFEAGPQFSFLINGERKERRMTNTGGVLEEHRQERDISAAMQQLDLGFAAGIGYQTDLGVGIGLRYNQGFREVNDSDNWKKNVVWQLSAFYLLGKRRELKAAQAGEPAVAPGVDYYKKDYNKSYRITYRTNVPRVSFAKLAESDQRQVRIKLISTGSYEAKQILMNGSSGTEENSDLFLGFRQVVFPFKGTIQFSVPNSIGSQSSTLSRLEYELYEPGLWLITITIGR